MRKACITLLCLLSFVLSQGQNLVPNPSFETHTACPTLPYGMIAYSPTYSSFPTVSDWVAPILYNSPDYFDTCSTGLYGVPYNRFGYQPAHTGYSYAGLAAYSGPSSGIGGGEYLETKLMSPLIAGQKYYVSFYASNAYWLATGGTITGVDRIGIHFSTSQINDTISSYQRLYLSMDVGSARGDYLTDSSAAWKLIAGYYTATGGEEWITMGHFFDTSFAFADTSLTPSTAYHVSYIYIDDVSVIAADSVALDTSFCVNSFPYVLHATTFTGARYHWSTGDTTATGTITAAGKYWCKISNSTLTVIDTFHVGLSITKGIDTAMCVKTFPFTLPGTTITAKHKWNTGDTSSTITIAANGTYWRRSYDSLCINYTDTFRIIPSKTKGIDTIICVQSLPVTLYGSTTSGKYLWSTADTTASIHAFDPGIFWRYTTNGSCINYYDTFNVQYSKTGGIDTALCTNGYPLIITPPAASGAYLWNTGQNTVTITVHGPGTYIRNANDHICSNITDTFTTNIYPQLELGNDTSVCMNVKNFSIGYDQDIPLSYQWSSGETTCCIIPSQSGHYILTISNQCGTTSDDINIDLIDCSGFVAAPSAFSPNGDGSNDVLLVRGKNIATLYFAVYNRWGQKIFETTNINKGWDGTLNGNLQPEETYAYIIQATFLDGNSGSKRGSVILLR